MRQHLYIALTDQEIRARLRRERARRERFRVMAWAAILVILSLSAGA